MNEEFYRKSIENLLVQVEKLKEEKDFYKTGRSGFITVDLGEVLYGKD